MPVRTLWICFILVIVLKGQPPAPPPPPAFMGMKGLPLACFDKPNFEQDQLEFFVCNGGGGISGVRKKSDPKRTITVRDADIAHNLNMQLAKRQCGSGKRFGVGARSSADYFFLCAGKEVDDPNQFQVGSAAEWKKYDRYLTK